MGILNKKSKEPDEPRKKVEPFNPPKAVKTDVHCVNDGCYEAKAPGQTHVCAKHVRAG